MAIYQICDSSFKKIEQTTFADRGIKERADLQRLLKSQIGVIADDVMVISEEFGDWDGSKRRVDLLALDLNANIVVIELKRTEDGGHMELQAIRYASMLSTMTFEQVVKAHASYLKANDIEGNAEEKILSFLDWAEPDEDQFAQDIRVILASAEFSKELTTSVMWLNERNLDIRCVRMSPYFDGEKTLLDVQQVIPLPEANAYQIKVREKQQKERQARNNSRDFTRFTLKVGDKEFNNLAKRWLMFRTVSAAIAAGKSPEDIQSLIDWRKNLFVAFEGNLDSDRFITELMKQDKGGALPRNKRFFCDENELFYYQDKTYALTNQWGVKTIDAVELINENYSLGLQLIAET